MQAILGVGRARWPALLLAAILMLASYLHFVVATQSAVPMPMASDSSEYFSYAYNLRNHGIYSDDLSWADEMQPGGVRPDSMRPPGYPLFLLAIPGLDASEQYLQRVVRVQALLGVLSVWLFYLLARRFLRPGWVHAATLLVATSPHLANLETNLLSETLFLFVLLVSTLATVRAFEQPGRARFALAGVAWSLCAFVRPTVLLVPVLLAAACWLAPRMQRFRAPALWLLAAFVLVQSPWWIRNRVADLDPQQGNPLLWSIHHGSYPDFMYDGRVETLGWPFRADPGSVEAERDWGRLARDLGAKFGAQPLRQLRWYLLGKPGMLLSWGYVQGHDIYVYDPMRTPWRERRDFAMLRVLALWLHWPLMLGGVAVAGLAWWRPSWLHLEGRPLLAARLCSALVLYALAFHLVVAPYPRYGVPFRPLLYALALCGFAALAAKTPARAGVSSGAAGS